MIRTLGTVGHPHYQLPYPKRIKNTPAGARLDPPRRTPVVPMPSDHVPDTPRILALEDHPLFSEALHILLSTSGFSSVELCPNVAEARQRVMSVAYDLCLLDLNLNGFHGADLIHDFKSIRPAMRILVVSMFNDVSLVDMCLRKGADGYLCKECPPDEYIPAIRQVLAGRQYISSDLRERLGKHRSRTEIHNGGAARTLTLREMNVLGLLGSGDTIQTIASQLNISPKTVESHCASIKRKLGLATMNELIRYAVRMDVF